MRIKLLELQTQSGLSDAEMSAKLWPDTSRQTQRVLFARAKTRGSVYIRLDQLKMLRDEFATTNLDNLIDFEDENPNLAP